jgi:hypothetical protein
MPFLTTPERLGIAQGLRRGIKALLKVQFGDDGLQLLPEIEEIHDHLMLEEVIDALETASTLDDVRQVWTPKPLKNQGTQTQL